MHTDTEYLRGLAENQNLPTLMRDTLRDAAAEIEKLRSLVAEAPKFFSHHSFDGNKLEWLMRAGLVGQSLN